jgi:hypothetical protein
LTCLPLHHITVPVQNLVQMVLDVDAMQQSMVRNTTDVSNITWKL